MNTNTYLENSSDFAFARFDQIGQQYCADEAMGSEGTGLTCSWSVFDRKMKHWSRQCNGLENGQRLIKQLLLQIDWLL